MTDHTPHPDLSAPVLDLHWEAAELLELAERRRRDRRDARLGALAAHLADLHPRAGLAALRRRSSPDPLMALAEALVELRPVRPAAARVPERAALAGV